ncbi:MULTISPECIES: FG-GAP repeat domain-containing protein [Streptomyces]|uniref:VCBS repeat-containing protein n=1 Tax=Streptomyces globisporus TaxID=1908 RepID=A0A927BJG9_STRGL|nr:VCBS repeat-containing protein [Streptomyces californicus]MBD2828794.1 VCBS repeat-containing protein [Streptomyces globisporus]NEC41551.1 VCBS repeat-containing protein [Streptomyces sp. SID8016]QRV55336.1 VCBS repeat-containing protein [Streptomyces californicus]
MTSPMRSPKRAARGSTALAATAAVLSAFVLGFGPGAPFTGSASALAAGCSGVDADFNGDGVRDTVIADPEAAVGGVRGAGVVHIVYGGGKGSTHLSQETAGVPRDAAADDGFGSAVAVYDADADGCSDIAVGIPNKDLSTIRDAGLVQVIYGSGSGLAAGRTTKEYLQGSGSPLGGTPETGDWVGYALAAGKTAAGTSYLLIGAPGESLGTLEDAGEFYYVSANAATAVGINQATTTAGPVPGDVEVDDRYGASFAATPTHFAVGTPGEAIGPVPFGGAVAIFSHTLVSGIPKPLRALGQDAEGVSGAEEPGDGFSTALAMIPYRPAGATSTTESLLAVGIPGEDLSTTVDAGAVQVFRITATGAATQVNWIDQDLTSTEEQADAGDFFGQRLAAVNTAPDSAVSAATTRLAVGVPGEESSEEHPEKGGIQIFPLVGEPGGSDAWIAPGEGIPGEPAHRQLAGMSLGATPSALYVGMPYGPSAGHAVHAFGWNVASGGTPTRTFKPGEDGIPTGDVAFGAVAR